MRIRRHHLTCWGSALGKRDEKASCEDCPEESVCVCVYVYAYRCKCICICACACLYAYVCLYMHMCLNVYAHAHVPVYMHMYALVYAYVCVCGYGYVYMCTRVSIQLHMCILVTQLYPTSCDPPGSSVHGISQAGILEWVAISFSRGSS